MKKRVALLTTAALFAMSISGCGKKENEKQDDTTEVVTQDTSTSEEKIEIWDYEDEDENVIYDLSDVELDDNSFLVNSDNILIQLDTSGINNQVNKIIPVEVSKWDQEKILDLCTNIFDDGEFSDTSPLVHDLTADNCGVELVQTIVTTEDDLLREYGTTNVEGEEVGVRDGALVYGQIDGFRYQLSYYYTIEGSMPGDYYIELQKLDASLAPCMISYVTVPEEEYPENRCNKDELTKQAQDLMERMGYGDYELVRTASTLNRNEYSMELEDAPDGYEFTFNRVIEGAVAPYAHNFYFYRSGVPYITRGERVTIYINSKGLMSVEFPLNYEAIEPGVEADLLPYDTILEIAKEEISNQYRPGNSGYFACESQFETLYVDLAYIPLYKNDCIEYTPVYLFTYRDSFQDTEYWFIQYAISAEDGQVVETYIDPNTGMK